MKYKDRYIFQWHDLLLLITLSALLPSPDQVRGHAEHGGHEEEGCCQVEWDVITPTPLVHCPGQRRAYDGRHASEHRQQPEGAGQVVDAAEVHEHDGGEGDVGGDGEPEHGADHGETGEVLQKN